ncbi:MAG: carboxypeptidase M32 [Bacteroidota bacterium]
MNAKELYQQYVTAMRKIADIKYSIAVLGWDQECYQPKKGAEFRAQQIGTLSGMAHDLFVDDKLGEILSQLKSSKDLSETQKRNVEETYKDYTREKKYPTSFVEKIAQITSQTYQAWLKAREQNDFKVYSPMLATMIDMKREEAEILGYENHPYNALLDLYEPGAKTEELDILFKEVRSNLVDFVKEIAAKPQLRTDFLKRNFPHQQQWDFGIEMLKQMGYDFDAGRQDVSPHPFTTNFSMQDVRVTTRVNENDFSTMLWSCIHEGGHALYEQGLLVENYGLPLGEAVSLGIHESQSRLWENLVGRGFSYWKGNFPKLKNIFSVQLNDVTEKDFYKGINKVQPSYIRVEADELTYHFHIMVRFEIEKGLMDKSIQVKDLSEIWNARYKEYLNVEVPNDNKGVLQDIHWSHGSIGYFPTYSLGSFYAVQFFNQATIEIAGLNEQIERGELLQLREWLREKIHVHGRRYTARELCQRITGEPLNFQHFMNYARKKYTGIYE